MPYFMTSWLTPQKFIFTLILRSGKSQIKVSIVLNFLKISCIYIIKYDHIYPSHLNVIFFCNSPPKCARVWGHIVGAWETSLCPQTHRVIFQPKKLSPVNNSFFCSLNSWIADGCLLVFLCLSCSLYANILCVFTSFNKDTVSLVLRTQLQDLIYPLSLYGKCCFKNKAKQP